MGIIIPFRPTPISVANALYDLIVEGEITFRQFLNEVSDMPEYVGDTSQGDDLTFCFNDGSYLEIHLKETGRAISMCTGHVKPQKKGDTQ